MSVNGTWSSAMVPTPAPAPTPYPTSSSATTSVSLTTHSTQMASVVAEGALLEVLSSQQQKVNVVVVGVLAVIIIVGLLGNMFVLAVYRPRSGSVSSSPAVLFILVMAGLDMASCVLSVPYEILDLMRPYNNDNVTLCRAFRFLTTVVSQSRGLMLLCVAWDRYLKICLPLTSYTCRHAKAAVFVVVLISLVLSWPQIVLNGQVTIHTHVPGILATDCNIVPDLPALYSLLYHGVLYLLFIVSFAMYGVLYGRIFYVLWRNGWFESSAASSSSGYRQGKSEAAPTINSRAGAAHNPNPSVQLELRQFSHNAEDCVDRTHRQKYCMEECGELSCHRSHCSDQQCNDLCEVKVCDGTHASTDGICPKTSQDRDEVRFARQIAILNKPGFHKMHTSAEDLASDSLSAVPRNSCRKCNACSSVPESEILLSTDISTRSQSTNESVCQLLFENYFLDGRHLHRNKWSAAERRNCKEKHPRALFRCQPVQSQIRTVKTNSDFTKPATMRRSQSEPCCDTFDKRTSMPLLRHCCASSDVMDSLVTDAVSQNTDVSIVFDSRTDVRKVTAFCHDHTSLTVDNTKQTVIGASSNSDAVGLDDSFELHTESYERAEMCMLCGKSRSQSDSVAEQTNYHDCQVYIAQHQPTALCYCAVTADFNKLQSKVTVEKDIHSHRTETIRCANPEHFTQPNCQQQHDRNNTARGTGDLVCISTGKNSGKRSENESTDEVENKHSFGEDINRIPAKTSHTGSSGKTECYNQNEAVCTKTNPKSTQNSGIPSIILHRARDANQRNSSEASDFCYSGEKKVARNGSLQVNTRSANHNLIVTRGSPIGTVRISDNNCSRETTAPDSRAEDRCNGKIRRHGGKRLRMGKTTMMLAMVTLSTVLCFVPFLTVIVMRTSGTRFQNQTSSTGDLVYMFCIRSFFLNNIVNPFVYFYVNPRFRRKVRGLFRHISRCLLQFKYGNSQSEMSSPQSDT